jgi:uncharacterized membrane protein YsdA (DUF1294 family)
MQPQARRKHPVLFHFVTGGCLVLALTVLLWWALRGSFDWTHFLFCWLLAVNVIAFAYYGYDKAQARASADRVPEVVLHGFTAAGGALGAYAAMRFFRHKTIKGSFRIVFWMLAAVQVVLLVWIIKLRWWG